MIHINASNSVKQLSRKLAENLSNHAPENALAAQWIVTQTEGLNGWLKIDLANLMGIAANLQFFMPNQIVSKLYQWTLPGETESMDSETVKWYIYALLGDESFMLRFPSLASYYRNDGVRQISLATELADLFDQYQVYRPMLINEWNHAEKQGLGAEDWQPYIWQKLKKWLGEDSIDRAEILEKILKKLEDNNFQKLLKKRMPQLHFFGIAVIAPYFLNLYKALAQSIDIHLYLPNPAPEQYWMEDATEKQIARLRNQPNSSRFAEKIVGNELLLNWGKITKTSFALMLNDDDWVNQYDTSLSIAPENPNTLLKKIQSDIYYNSVGADRSPIEESDLTDNSITLTGSFTPLREVEVLYNHLIGYLSQHNGAYSARDILVLVSDIDNYAPYINAVFKNAPYKFPYSIADESITADNNMFTALRDILMLDTVHFKAEDVLELLDSSYIRTRFGITDLEEVRTTVRQAGIIMGMNGREMDDTYLISWEYGLKKILYGLCMSGETEYHDGKHSFTPLDTAEGAGMIERIRLIHFVEILRDKIKDRSNPRSIHKWADYLKELLEDLIFEAGEKDDDDYPVLMETIEQLALMDNLKGVNVPFAAFRFSFLQQLSFQKKSQAFTGPGITFCSLIPMRSIPFPIIAMLGMNFDKFPRKNKQLSFSLIDRNPLPGDRNIKDNDKHLFLETILSAQDHLYISYIARNEKDGSELPPTSLLDELIDYVAKGLDKDTDDLRKEWVTVNPLHGFSSKYFNGNGLVTYLSDTRYKTNINIRESDTKMVQFDFSVIELGQLVKFLKNPPKTYLNKQFNIYYEDKNTLLPDHELFEMDTLSKFGLLKDAISLTEDKKKSYLDRLRQTNQLPLKNMADAAYSQYEEESGELLLILHGVIDGEIERTVEIRIQHNGWTLQGKVGGIFGEQYVGICNSSDRFKYLIGDYVQYLALVAQGERLGFTFVDKKVKKPQTIAMGIISKREALQTLDTFIGYFKDGHQSYFPFFPALAADKLKPLNKTYVEFQKWVSDKLDDDKSFVLKDDYLNQAIKDGFFGEDNFEGLKHNTEVIMGGIMDRLPELF